MIQAKKYNNRAELEKFIRAEIGDDMQRNKEANLSITGTRAELERLKLSDQSMVWGIKCVISDTPTKDFKGVRVGQIKK